MSLGLLLGWISSLLLGAAIWFAAAGLPRRLADWLAAAGYALLLGLGGCGLLVGLRRATPGADLFLAVLPLLALAVLLCVGIGFLIRRRAATAAPAPSSVAAAAGALPWWGWALLLLIALRFVVLLDEAWLRPVFVWDAWNAWSLKAKTWFGLGQVPFVEPTAWWSSADVRVHTALAWRYPELLSRIELWLAASAGAWNEAAVASAWPLLWLGLIAGCAGQWIALGVPGRLALVCAYVLASLPLLSVHAGLAGYADLWVAAALAFGVLSGLRWLQTREPGQLALGLLCLGMLPLLKFEGAVWLLLVLGAFLFVQVPSRWRWAGLGAGLLLAVLVLGVSWLLHLPWLGLLRDTLSGATGGSSEVPRLAAALAFLSGLFGQNNWHLLWALLIAVVIWQFRELRMQRVAGLLALLLAGGLVALFCLFVFTPAAKWAASATATNRLVLHWVPLAVSLLALLLPAQPWRRDRPAVSAP